VSYNGRYDSLCVAFCAVRLFIQIGAKVTWHCLSVVKHGLSSDFGSPLYTPTTYLQFWGSLLGDSKGYLFLVLGCM